MPSLSPDHLGQGQHSRAQLSKALYLTDAGPVVYATFTRSAYKINLSDGTRYRGDLAFAIHSARWRIEGEDGAGNFTTLREFTA